VRILRPEHFRGLDERLALAAALELMRFALLVCRDQDEYLSLVMHRRTLEAMRQRLADEETKV
jgi:hypothetical protein